MKTSFHSLIQSRKFEDINVLGGIEKILKAKRKKVFTLPKPGTDVVLLVSGGLDSILTWGLLLDRYKLRVHPLFLNKGEKRKKREEESVEYFSAFYEEKYPHLFIKPVKQTIYLPQKEIIHALKTPYDNLELYDRSVTKDFDPSTTSNIFLGSPGLVPQYGFLYARYYELMTGIKIRTLFSSIMLGDGTVCPSQTITSIRAINLAMCTFSGDYTYQFTSPSVEPYMKNLFEKKDMIRWGHKVNIPMEKTWSCYRGGKHQCGICLACASRKEEFRRARVQDKTIYMKSLKQRIKELAKKILRVIRTAQ